MSNLGSSSVAFTLNPVRIGPRPTSRRCSQVTHAKQRDDTRKPAALLAPRVCSHSAAGFRLSSSWLQGLGLFACRFSVQILTSPCLIGSHSCSIRGQSLSDLGSSHFIFLVESAGFCANLRQNVFSAFRSRATTRDSGDPHDLVSPYPPRLIPRNPHESQQISSWWVNPT
jgi:hypothetical protein